MITRHSILLLFKGSKTQTLQDSLNSLPQIPADERVIERGANWGFSLDRKGKNIYRIGLFIDSAAYKKACLLHSDHDFEVVVSVGDLEEEKI